MSDVASKELRIVGFLCNWCSYGGADTAGVGRFQTADGPAHYPRPLFRACGSALYRQGASHRG